MTELKYRKASESDITYLLWLRRQTMDDHLNNSGFIVTEADQLLRIKYLFDSAKIIMLDDEKIGLLKVDEKVNEVEIVQVQIDPRFQGKGIGRKVISSVIDDSLNRNKKISLSVLKVNPARELYLRMGFEIVDDDESSFIMVYKN